MGQVMHRLGLDCTGKQAYTSKKLRTFQIVASLAAVFYIVDIIVRTMYYMEYTKYATMSTAEDGTNIPDDELSAAALASGQAVVILYLILFVSTLIYVIWMVCTLTRTRLSVRERYEIQGSAVEDCCCSLWCTCCTMAQLHFHTGEYETHSSVCCSKTGLRHGINVV
jgi:Cys-rich protein (TIGR01571 family)